jgi:hypothetical protein
MRYTTHYKGVRMRVVSLFKNKRSFVNLLVAAGLFIGLLTAFIRPAYASTSLSGHVTDGSNTPVANVTITISEDPGQTTPQPSDVVVTTDSNGDYTTSLTGGHKYQFVFSPPSGSGLVATTYYHYTVPVSASSLNVTLRSASYTVSGVLKDSNNVVLPNEAVHIYDGNGDVGEATTDASGAYSITAPATDKYILRIDATRTDPLAVVPLNFTWKEPLNLSASNQTKNLTFQSVDLTAAVRDASGGVPAVPAAVALNYAKTSATFTSPIDSSTVNYGQVTAGSQQTDGSGNTVFNILVNSAYSLTATGDSSEGYGNVTNTGSVTTSAASQTMTLPTDRKTITGIVYGNLNGQQVAAPGVQLRLKNTTTNKIWTVISDGSGAYAFGAPTGTNYSMLFDYTAGQWNAPWPGTVSGSFSVNLSQNRTGTQIKLPFNSIQVFVKDNLSQNVAAATKINLNANYTQGMSGTFPGAGTATVDFSSGFSSTGAVADDAQGIRHERWVPDTSPVTISAAVPNSFYVQSANANYNPNSDKSGYSITISNTLTAFGGTMSFTTPTSSNPSFSWTNYNAPAGTDHYNVYRNGVLIGTTTTKSYTDTSATSPGRYYYQMSTVGGLGEVGPKTKSILITRQ